MIKGTTPTEPGWYMLRLRERWICAEVTSNDGDLGVTIDGDRNLLNEIGFREWGDRVVMPDDEVEVVEVKEPELKSCPFCGYGEVELTSSRQVNYIDCHACGATTATHNSRESSIKAWNRREGGA